LQRVVDARKSVRGKTHPETLASAKNLDAAPGKQDKREKAVKPATAYPAAPLK
jgi:hypothetical protein